ncbi:MAG: DUF805 domain-containing protein [Demequinaceae bacterium]|nr:DUF805 domain-containing protein [Demequinaceae bacterium]
MSFVESIKTCLSKYADFSGRARRSEYWWFYLAVMLTNWILFYAFVGTSYFTELSATNPDLEKYMFGMSLVSLVSVALLLPSLAALVRRLHDTDKSGAYFFIGLIPIAGPIILLVFLATEGTRGPNQYGPDPKAMA